MRRELGDAYSRARCVHLARPHEAVPLAPLAASTYIRPGSRLLMASASEANCSKSRTSGSDLERRVRSAIERVLAPDQDGSTDPPGARTSGASVSTSASGVLCGRAMADQYPRSPCGADARFRRPTERLLSNGKHSSGHLGADACVGDIWITRLALVIAAADDQIGRPEHAAAFGSCERLRMHRARLPVRT